MNVENERSRSLWMQVERRKSPPLGSNLRVETLVIGAGIAGLSTAYELVERGHKVAVVDRGAIGGGMTARTSAHLAHQIDDLYFNVIKSHGEETARLYFKSQRAAVDRIESISAKHRIDCDFARIDLYLFAPDRRGRRELDEEIDAAAKIGFEGVEWADAPVHGGTQGCLRFPNQARFHPLRYLIGVRRAIERAGGQLFADTAIVSVKETGNGVSATTESGHTISARWVVDATNAPFVNRLAVHTKQAPYRTYVMTAPVPKGSVIDALIWDTENPYHYVRIHQRANDDLLIFGGEDHKSGTSDDAEKRLRRLEAWARERFPMLGPVKNAWSGQIYEPTDYLPFIGRSPGRKRVFIVSGDSGEGLTTGVAASLILPDLIEGKETSWAKPYSPRRKVTSPSSFIDYVKDRVDAAKHLIEHVADGGRPEDIARGSGSIIKLNGKKHAAYRDKRGELHVMKAACTHLGCSVQWNSFEECWDCPCHGSQFAPTGEVLQCPAVSPLEVVETAVAENAPGAGKAIRADDRAERRGG